MPRPSLIRLLALLLLALALPACGGSKRVQRLHRQELQDQLKAAEKPGLTIGDFPLESVLDGDTVRVGGLSTSLRLLGIDSEETFKTEGDRRLFEAGWDDYLKKKRGTARHPVKMATPLGEEAKVWAKKFFERGTGKVRLERDHPLELRDAYGRYLTYVFAFIDGQWVNYNVESVRAGMSPYFSKYGYSRRFHRDFVEAEKEARLQKLGIWSDDGQHYPDYDERKLWWDARADYAREVEARNEGKKDFIVLTNWDSMYKLEKYEGREVTILGIIGEVRRGDHGPSTAVLSRTKGNSFSLVFFDKDVFGLSRVADYRGEFVEVKGVVSRYTRKGGRGSSLQIQVKLPGQIVGRNIPGMPPLFPEDDEDDPNPRTSLDPKAGPTPPP